MFRLMDRVKPSQLKDRVFVHREDFQIISETFKSQISLLSRIASRYNQADLTFNVAISKIVWTEVNT